MFVQQLFKMYFDVHFHFSHTTGIETGELILKIKFLTLISPQINALLLSSCYGKLLGKIPFEIKKLKKCLMLLFQ